MSEHIVIMLSSFSKLSAIGIASPDIKLYKKRLHSYFDYIVNYM